MTLEKYESQIPARSDSDRDDKLRQVVEAIFSTDSMRLKTVLKRRQVVALTRAAIFATRYKSDVMLDTIKFLTEWSVSVDAYGRKDLRAALEAALRTDEEQKEDQRASNMFARLIGR